MNPHNVVRVDWAAWASSDAKSRAACGTKAFMLATPTIPAPPAPSPRALVMPSPPTDDFERAARRKEPERRPRQRPVARLSAPVPPDPPHLPGIDAWLDRVRAAKCRA